MLKRLRLDEDGISLTEVMIAAAMASIIATAFITIFASFSRNVSLEEARAAALNDVQSAASSLTSELRQAVRVVADGPFVAVLESAGTGAQLVFYSDRYDDAPGPERYRYWLDGCTATHCNLMRSVTVADGTSPPWTYTGAATSTQVVANLILGGEPLFAGVDWGSGTEVVTTSCSTAPRCNFDLVRITWRVDPDPDVVGEEPLRVRHEVRMRNAR